MKIEAERLVRRLRPNRFRFAKDGRNNWVAISKDECISIPRDATKINYAVRVAAMKYLSRYNIPTTRFVDHGVLDGIEYVITRRIAAETPCIAQLSARDMNSVLNACGHVLRQIHLLDARDYGRLDSLLRGSHSSWKGFVEDYFLASMRRLSKDPALRARFMRTLDARFVEMLPLMDDSDFGFLHGDYHLGNILFLGKALKAVIDMDIVMRGDVHWDLGHFLLTCKCDRQVAHQIFFQGYGQPVDEARMRFYTMVIWTRKIASQAENRRTALTESVAELERILFS